MVLQIFTEIGVNMKMALEILLQISIWVVT